MITFSVWAAKAHGVLHIYSTHVEMLRKLPISNLFCAQARTIFHAPKLCNVEFSLNFRASALSDVCLPAYSVLLKVIFSKSCITQAANWRSESRQYHKLTKRTQSLRPYFKDLAER